MYEEDGQPFISRVEDGWVKGDQTFDALWMWTLGHRSKAWAAEDRKANGTKFSGAMAVYLAFVHFDQLEGVTKRTW